MSPATSTPARPTESALRALGAARPQRLTPTELERRLEAHLLIARRLPGRS